MHTLVPALQGLRDTTTNIPALLVQGGKTVSVADKSKNVKVEIVDGFGKQYKGAKNVKVQMLDLSDNKAAVKDVTSQVKVDNS